MFVLCSVVVCVYRAVSCAVLCCPAPPALPTLCVLLAYRVSRTYRVSLTIRESLTPYYPLTIRAFLVSAGRLPYRAIRVVRF